MTAPCRRPRLTETSNTASGEGCHMSDDADGAGGRPAELDSAALFSLLGKTQTVGLLCELLVVGDPPVRFNQLSDALDVSPTTLSRRLDELEAVGFVTRHSYDEIPPRVEYEPTEKLYALEPTFRELGDWLESYGDDETFVLPEE